MCTHTVRLLSATIIDNHDSCRRQSACDGTTCSSVNNEKQRFLVPMTTTACLTTRWRAGSRLLQLCALKLKKKKRIWVREWLRRRGRYGMSILHQELEVTLMLNYILFYSSYDSFTLALASQCCFKHHTAPANSSSEHRIVT